MDKMFVDLFDKMYLGSIVRVYQGEEMIHHGTAQSAMSNPDIRDSKIVELIVRQGIEVHIEPVAKDNSFYSFYALLAENPIIEVKLFHNDEETLFYTGRADGISNSDLSSVANLPVITIGDTLSDHLVFTLASNDSMEVPNSDDDTE